MSKKRICEFPLAAVWTGKIQRDLSGWFWNEKLDGVRAIWDSRRGLISRNGIAFTSPGSFTCTLPKGVLLDGELWIDRGMFHDVVSVIRTRSSWTPLVKYKVFDVWSPYIRDLGYRDRIEWLQNEPFFKELDDHISLVDSKPLIRGDPVEVALLLESVLALGGEGLILRDPNGKYECGRKAPNKSSILKVKPFLDEEAQVLRVSLNYGRKGSVTVRDRRGRVFKIGSGFGELDAQNPPSVGSIITFGYTSRNPDTGTPRFPRYIRTRSDVDL
jgi:DNA ligase-1